MIEFAMLDNGPTDLRIRQMASGVLLPDGDLEAMHESRRRTTVNQVRMAILAEKLGFHYSFFTEHHFQPEGAEYSPNPLILGAAIAVRTKRIRIGQMANILSWWHPIRLAEQAAMVDVLSGGRLEFGIGRGAQPRETEIFGQVFGSTSSDEERTRAYCDECYEIITRAWTQPSFTYYGEFFSLPPKWTSHHHQQTIEYFSQPGIGRSVEQVLQLGEATGKSLPVYSHATTLKEMSVYPRPVQKPHPQVWQPIVVSNRTIRETARRGINAVFVASTVERVRQEVATYYEEAEKHDYPDRLDRGSFKHGWDCVKKRGVCHFQGVHIVDHGIGNMERARWGATHLWDYLSAYVPPGVPSLVPPVVERNAPSFFGSTQQVIDAFMEIKEAGGYEDFLCTAGFTHPGMSREEAEEQMHAFAQDVMPALKHECGGSPDLPEPDPALQI
jgi:alkanesulfonate monooxygenase SsuD/methylene tetrahydromethanopterin reductase-like flavin-dependent oxidoreductase (luciferase family)